jgi:UDP-glucuronate 4-epimerase
VLYGGVQLKILVTGAAGFIGFHLSLRLLQMGHSVVGVDNLNDYYDPTLKKSRLALLSQEAQFQFVRANLEDKQNILSLFESFEFTHVINLAAQAGVRYSLENPSAYVKSNIEGFLNILEGCRHSAIEHLVFASSSSVYGLNETLPFQVSQNVDHPISLYAASKKANELMAHSYSHLYGIPCTGLRFFTVYGPWGRPDMVVYLWTKAILENLPIKVFNHGQMRRSFTYIDDVIEGLVRVLVNTPMPNLEWSHKNTDPSRSSAPYRIYNIGNSESVELRHFLSILEGLLNKEAIREDLPMQPGDVLDNSADVADLVSDVGYNPTTSIEEGLEKFVVWYKEYYKI